MRRALMASPHFPPDMTAGTHRVRLLAPHLAAHGSEPTVVTVDPRDYERCLDPELAELVPRPLRVVRARAWSARWTRHLGCVLAGLAVVLSDTARQRPLAADLGEAALSYRPGDVAALATGLRRLAEGKSALAVAQAAAWRAAVCRWDWEHPAERGALLAAVEEALS